MPQRGRKSVSEKAVKVVAGNFGQRPEPPDYLTDRQAEIWRECAASETPDLFGTQAMRSMLADYCRHRESIEKISQVLDVFEADWLKNAEGAKRYKDLLKMREAEVTSAARLARNMRLTNQSRYTPQRAATASQSATAKMPWEQ